MMKKISFWLLSLSLLITISLGCETQNTSAPDSAIATQPTESTPQEEPAPSSTQYEREGIKAVVTDWETTQAWIAQQKGKVVVLDIWSTWCLPCVQEYPHLVTLQKKHPEKVACASLNVNFNGVDPQPTPEEIEEVLAFLVKEKSQLHNVISSTPDEKIYETIDVASIPVVFVYGPDGKLKKRFDNESQEYGEEGFNYEKHITPYVEKLLATP